jgi:hypothetical protein
MIQYHNLKIKIKKSIRGVLTNEEGYIHQHGCREGKQIN